MMRSMCHVEECEDGLSLSTPPPTHYSSVANGSCLVCRIVQYLYR